MAKCVNKYLDDNIKILDLDQCVIDVLYNNEINLISDLWICNRKKLKEFGIKDTDIKQIIIKLQLIGLDLNKKVYR